MPDCKIIFITGYMQTKYLKDAIDLSAVAFIEKPIQPEAVLEALEKAVEKIRRQPGNRAIAKRKYFLSEDKISTFVAAEKYIGGTVGRNLPGLRICMRQR